MSSVWVANIPRPASTNVEKTGPSITNVEHLSSYNWIESSSPTIAVPGCPPAWSPPGIPQKVAKDSGLIYIAQNAFRHPQSPLEPLFRSLYIERPSYNICEINLITDRNNVRKLLSFINPNLSRNGSEPFTIEVEVAGNTTIFCRTETETFTFVGPHEFRGYGHEFEKAFTKCQVPGSTGHHRIISYNLGDLKFLVRYETDAYVEEIVEVQHQSVGSQKEKLLGMMENLSLSGSGNSSHSAIQSNLVVENKGKQVPISATLEIKTRVSHKPLSLQDVLPQLWISQTPNLVIAYHKSGTFVPPEAKDVTCEIAQWERTHSCDLQRLVALVKVISKVVRENGGNSVIKYDGQSDGLSVSKRKGGRMLPDDLYSRLRDEMGSREIKSQSHKTAFKIGDALYNVDISAIPYLSSFVRFQRLAQPQSTEFIHGNIALFDIALKGLESGYRQCFRCLRANIPQYPTLCETYEFLGVDVLAGQSIDDIFVDLKACKTYYELDYKRYRAVKGNKSRARDAAFRLLFMIIRGEFSDERRDPVKVYNAVLFVVSHPGTFKQGTRNAVRSVFEERFFVSKKQRSQLDRWQKGETTNSSDNEITTEDEFDEPFLSEGS